MVVSVVVAAALAGAAQAACAGDTTPDINACAAADARAADEALDRYLAAARARLQEAVARKQRGADGAVEAFEAADRAWRDYRRAECGAVYDCWSEGSIRTVTSLTCQIQVTKLRTRQVWRTWLTYPDSTPPILPDPGYPAGR